MRAKGDRAMSSKTGCGMVVTAIMGLISFAFSIATGVLILTGLWIWLFAWLGSTPRNPDGTRKRSRLTIDGE